MNGQIMVKFSMLAAAGLAVGAIVAGAGVGAAPAHADSTADSTFIQQLDKAGIPYVNPYLAVGRATAMCLYLNQGHTEAEALLFTAQTDRANATSLQDAQFAQLAEAIYCPNELSSAH
ncbi:hypothetical protein I545_4043 [Mycobacterium kansasii 662]|nr:DUF732 domain-containing protein [Mycobacterium pseudokansasii]EUA16432.1 hypothetical protein I545_4043 [Mycobacterium kansasii 662]KZS67470.1 hypothetical protein A4G27_12710 [Mycobacterium kansasii]ORC11613.1 hypothetical protein B1T46_13355 [Mycobacterium kansasii]POX97641.1 DUF732 domain-containing protein [Mycobacterium kansasii]